MTFYQKSTICWCVALVIQIPNVSAQPIPDIEFEAIDIPALRSLAVQVIFKDEAGFIWIGGQTGLYRYDGYEVFSVTDLDPSATWLSGAFIRTIREDASGNIWIAYQHGIARWNDEEHTFEDIEKLSDYIIFDVLQPLDSLIWMVSNEGFIRYDHHSQSFRLYPYISSNADTLKTYFATNMYLQHDRWLWSGIDSGVMRFDLIDQEFEMFAVAFRSDSYIPSLQITGNDASGEIILGSFGDGLFHKSVDGEVFLPFRVDTPEFQLGADFILGLQYDQNGRLWVATRNNGITILDSAMQSVEHHFDYVDSSSEDPIRSIAYSFLLDDTGLSWIGTLNGIYRQHSGNRAPGLNTLPGGLTLDLNGEGVKATYIDARGFLWVGTFQGSLRQIDPTSGRELWNDNLPGSVIYYLDQDQEGNMWVATSSGLRKLDVEAYRWIEYSFPGRVIVNTTDRMATHTFMDSRDSIWVSSGRRGLWIFDQRTETFQRPHFTANMLELSNAFFSLVFEDRTGHFWIGAEYLGLFRYDLLSHDVPHFTHIPGDTSSLSNNRILSISEDQKGDVWIGTRNGLNRYDDETKSFRSFTSEDGLPNNEISCIVPDKGHNLWIATRLGLVRLDIEANDIFTYSEHDGLPATNFMFNSCSSDAEGNIYMGSEAGLFRFHPNDLMDEMPQPSIKITGYELRNDRHFLPSDTHSLTFDHDQNYLTFYFSLVEYLGLEASQYQYRLTRGDDEAEWIPAGRRNFATYSDLNPGVYNFEVKGRNYRGLESNVASLSVTINPPFWLTWWFVLLASTLVLVTGMSVYRWRVNRLLEVQDLKQANTLLEQKANLEAERTRTQIARDLHDDMGSEASRLVMALERMMQEESLPDTLRKRIGRRLENARTVAQSVRDLSWLLDACRDTLQDLVDRMYREADSAFDEETLTFTVHDRITDLKLESSARRDLFLIYREALTNIQRHAHATKVRISIHLKDREFGYDIVDDGVGCDLEDSIRGNGRINMQRRAERIGATLNVKSEPGMGMSVSVRYTIKNGVTPP